MREAWIVNVGTEILRGRVVNTNAAWIAEELSKLGFRVSRIIVAPDSVEDVSEELSRALARADLVVTTGGLGLGPDDITLEAIAVATGRKLELNPEALKLVEAYCEKHGFKLTSDRMKLAMTPQGAIAIENPIGAAPGVLVRHEGRIVLALPGVPREARAVFELAARLLVEDGERGALIAVDCLLEIENMRESDIAEALSKIKRELGEQYYVKSYPRGAEYSNPSVAIEISSLTTLDHAEKCLERARRAVEALASEAEKAGGVVVSKHCGSKSSTDSGVRDHGSSGSDSGQ